MIKKFSEAFAILGTNWKLISVIILTVWLPGNLLIKVIEHYVPAASELGNSVRIYMAIESAFGPVYIGALMYALYQIKMGNTVTYKAAMAVGFRKWGVLFLARFSAGIFIMLGLIALVVPGIMLFVRYALIDSVVVLENSMITDPKARSTNLTDGRRWQIFGAGILFFIPFFALSFLVYLPFGFFETPLLAPVEFAVDCLLDVGYAVIQIVMFLFYWDSTRPTSAAEPNTPPIVGPSTEMGSSAGPESRPFVS